MSTRRHRVVWTPSATGSTAPPLERRLGSWEADRASDAEGLVTEMCEGLTEEFVQTRELESWADARAFVTSTLAPLRAAHGWRAPVARWFRSLDELVTRGEVGRYEAPARELLIEELGLWLGGHGAGESDWSGAPLEEGRRMPDRVRVAGHATQDLERGEVILVHGYTRTVLRALEEAQQRGLSPEVVVTEGGPDLGGRRMARALVAAGVKVRMVYDAALLTHVNRSDRVWLGTEAIGAEGFLARVGTASLLQESLRREVPVQVLATSDKVAPQGELTLPAWGEEDAWLLWERAPEGVRLESQAFEVVPFDAHLLFLTEHGPLGVAELAVRALTGSATLDA